MTTFLKKFFPESKRMQLKNLISTFQMWDDEFFGDAWERFKDLLRQCTMHGFEPWKQIVFFYEGCTEYWQTTLNAIAGGELLAQPLDSAFEIIEGMRNNKIRWSDAQNRHPH